MGLISGAGFAGDTIFALASGMGISAISVVRLSGPKSGRLLLSIAGRLPTPRQGSVRALRDADGGLLDRALVLWFPAPGSYTGEDTVEFHLHGGRAVLDAVTATMLQHGARPAMPGEFTRRAFVNGRIDLLEAEAIGDLVRAESKAQRLHALDQASGGLSKVVAEWQARLTRCLAWQEAVIDFLDEIPPHAETEMLSTLSALRDELRAKVCGVATGQRLRHGLTFAIVGPPNAGKSSLLNALAEQDLAIVSRHPGTTRDAVRADITLGDIPVALVDTAGLRDTEDIVENEGVRRARQHAASADLVIELIDSSVGRLPVRVKSDLCVGNKIDLAPAPAGCLGISLLTGAGLPELVDCLSNKARELAIPEAGPAFSRARHAAALRTAEACLASALKVTQPELRAEELRLGLQALASITGEVSSEAVLDAVFSDFCIGK